ncbi:hypothetical protein ACB098_02G142200 [Castanea mollissima]|uniref:Uncharacterized protein n=1 Tax=Castanea mollissima TaxID=60419 RepID=A0A8J4RJX9_9ROSI|nr:hypothetical protein CMV_001990 [Castanea mollissima]
MAFRLLYYIGLAVVVANLADLTFSWCERKVKEIKSGKGKDAAALNEIDTIHRIIHMKGKAAKRMTVLELAKELRYYEVTEGIWSELLYSS